MKILVKFIAVTIYFGLSSVVFPLSLWLLINAITWTGRGLAIVGFLATILPASFYLQHHFKILNRTWQYLNFSLVIGLIGLVILILVTTPTGQPGLDSPVSHQFSGSMKFLRYRLTNIIPEAEQINLGFTVMPYLDPIFTHAQAQRVSGFTLDLYREIEQDPHFRELGSVLGWAYAEIFNQPFDVGHYYLYIPKNRPDGPLPAIVFLHGSLGNFKPYLWVWSRLAEREGFVIIAPSFGFGNWLRAGGVEAALMALEDAEKQVAIDPDQIYLAGLSNGGQGVSLLAELWPERFQGVIFLSPVMPGQIVNSKDFLDGWRGRPALIISGETDRRIPANYVIDRATFLEENGLNVTTLLYPNEDHFLFYSQPEKILSDISTWIDTIKR